MGVSVHESVTNREYDCEYKHECKWCVQVCECECGRHVDGKDMCECEYAMHACTIK